MQSGKKSLVYVTRKCLPKEAIGLLESKYDVRQYEGDEPVPRERLLKEVHDADALFCILTEKIDQELLDHAPNLKVIGTMSVGYEHVDVEACKKRKVLLGYTPDVLTETTAELAIGLLLCCSRRLLDANKCVYNGEWSTWKPFWMCGYGIHGSTVGILGMGRIGCSVARKIAAFDPQHIIYHNRTPMLETNGFRATFVSFDELLKQSDFLIICCQLNSETAHIINKSALENMKSNAILVNVSRGGVIDQDALYDALKSKRLGCAGLDVCSPEPLPLGHKLMELENIVLLPHIGSATFETRTRMAVLTAENIIAGLNGDRLPASIY